MVLEVSHGSETVQWERVPVWGHHETRWSELPQQVSHSNRSKLLDIQRVEEGGNDQLDSPFSWESEVRNL